MFVAVLRVRLFYVKETFHVSVFLTGRLFSPAKVISHRFEFSCTLLSYVSPNRLRLKLRRVEKLGRAADVTLSPGKRLRIYRCFFRNARPECDFRYFFNSAARFRSDIAILSVHGFHLDVCGILPSLCRLGRSRRLLVNPV